MKTLDDPEKNVTTIALDQSGNRIATIGWKKGIRILKADTGEVVKSIPDAVTDALIFTSGWKNIVTGRGTLGLSAAHTFQTEFVGNGLRGDRPPAGWVKAADHPISASAWT